MRIVVPLLILLVGSGFVAGKLLSAVRWPFVWQTVVGAAALAVGGLIFWWKRRVAEIMACQAKRNEARTARDAGDLAAAERFLLEAAEQAKAVNPGSYLAVIHWDLANLYNTQCRFDDAEQQLRSALQAAERSDSSYGRQIAEQGPDALLRLLRVREKWLDCEKLIREQKAAADSYYWSFHLGVALAKQGKLEDALGCFRRILLQHRDDKESLPRVHYTMGVAALEGNRIDTAIGAFKILRPLADQIQAPAADKAYWAGMAEQGLGKCYAARHDWATARWMFEASVRSSRQAQCETMHADCLYHFARTLHELGRRAEAETQATLALAIWRDEDPRQAPLASELLEEIRMAKA